MNRPTDAETIRATLDALILRKAARILRLRSTKPNSFTLNVLCRVLTNTAERER